MWDANTGKELLKLDGHTEPVLGVAVTPDGTRIVTGSGDTTARVWDANTGKELLKLDGHTSSVTSVAVTPDGTRIVTGSQDATARVWDANTGKELLKLDGHTRSVYRVAVTPDGARIVTGSEDNTARVWDANTGTELLKLEGYTDPVWGVAVMPDGKRIVTTFNNMATVRDANTGKELLKLVGHTEPVLGVAVTPDGTRIVTVSGNEKSADDNTARVWDANTGKELLTLKGHTEAVLGVAVTPDGTRIVTGSLDNTMRVWLLTPPAGGQALVEEAKWLVPRCLTPGERQRAYLAYAAPRWCAALEKWPYDSVSAFVEGQRLVREGNDDEAAAVFAPVLARDPGATKRVDEAIARGYIQRGSDFLLGRQDGEAIAAFSKAQALDPGAGKGVDEAWATAYVWRGHNLLGEGKDEEATALFAKALKRDPAFAKRIDQSWAGSYVDRGKNLLLKGSDEEATALFRKALARDPAASKGIDAAWVDVYIDRGPSLVRQGKDEEATAAFAKALALNPTAGKRIDDAWVRGFVERGSNLLYEVDSDAKAADQRRREALESFEQAVVRARRDGVAKNLLADAVHGRGRAFDGLKRYREAVADFKEASRLRHRGAQSWLWWATNRLAEQMSNQGQREQGLLMTVVNHLDLTPDLKESLEVRGIRSNTYLGARIADVHANLPKSPRSANVTNCDRLTAHPSDPYRVAPATAFESIVPPMAIAACDKAIKEQPNEARYLYQRGRAWSRAAFLAENDKTRADQHDAAALEDFKAAMAKGYPAAFNNVAIAYNDGRAIAKDQHKAADTYLETTNRFVHCCWEPVARHLIEQEDQHDKATVRRVVHELLLWADALGSERAGKMLAELYAKGALVRPTDMPPIGKADFKSLPPWLR